LKIAVVPIDCAYGQRVAGAYRGGASQSVEILSEPILQIADARLLTRRHDLERAASSYLRDRFRSHPMGWANEESCGAACGCKMSINVTFQPINAATDDSVEDAHLVWADGCLIAFLLPATEGWFMQLGLGPCEGEGKLFPTIGAAEAWMRAQFSESWRPSAP
jgi:hypothetical protein